MVSITIPNNVTSISKSVFNYCTALTSITIPNSVTSIGDEAFGCCESLSSITIPDSVTRIGSEAFWHCTSLSSVTIPNSVTSIGAGAFEYTGLTSITIPDSVTSIGDDAFYNCAKLTSATIQGSGVIVGADAFGNCTALETVYIPDSANICGSRYPAWSSNATLVITYDTGTITSSFFYCNNYNGGSGVKNIVISDNITTIESEAFYECESLTSVTIPNSVTSIGDDAFAYCTKLAVVSYAGTEAEWKNIVIGTGNSTLIHTYYGVSEHQWAAADPSDPEYYQTPSCEDDGWYFDICIYCGEVDEYNEHILPATGHSWVAADSSDPYYYFAADCVNDGWYYDVCSDCGEIGDEHAIEALGHDLTNHTGKAPTCTEGGWNAYQTCSRCDYTTYAEIAPLGHDLVIDPAVAATCTEPGLTAGEHCTRCDYKIAQETVPTLGHAWDAGAITTPVTATTDGVKTFTCARCGATKTEIIPATGEETCKHESTHAEHKDATCTEPGYDKVICDKCGAVISEETIPTLGHDWDAGVTAPAPTCTTAGIKTFTCKRCGETRTETIAALGHDLVTDPAKAATCTEPGLTEGQHCTRCDYMVAQQEVPALGHGWDDGKVTTPATETTDGVKTFTCTRCGATKTEKIPATGGKTNPFKDVKEGDFYYDAVLWAVNADPQVTSGTSATTFSPNDTCTRAQVVTFLWRAKGCPEPKSSNNPFGDVKAGEYYYKAVLWAVENEITAGTSKTTFSPNTGCTRAQVVTFLWRTEGQPKPTSSANPFSDVKGGYYYDAVLWAVEKGITAGTSKTTFSPDNTCTRGQIVTFLYRAFAA